MGTRIYISVEGAVYFNSRRWGEDDDILQLFSRALLGVTIDSTFDAVYSHVAREWHQQDDIINPFHDSRHDLIRTVWIFNLDNDVLRLENKDCYRQLPLAIVRSRAVTITDLHLCAPPRPPELGSQSFIPPPDVKLLTLRREGLDPTRMERRRAFVSRILADFAFQWRHMLCSRYRDSTFRKFAAAIIQIATLDFNVVELTEPRYASHGFLVFLHNLPEWDPFKEPIIPIAGTSTSIVISRHIPHAIAMIQSHFADAAIYRISRMAEGLSNEYRSYLILTVKEVFLYRIKSRSQVYTNPEPLFNGQDPPSEGAVQLLLEAIYGNFSKTRIHQLPIELQDLILDNVSEGPIERARVGCILECGSVFTWRCKNRNIEREIANRNRHEDTPVESQIWFGDHSGGVAYK
ncbi:hypothetical protein F5Y18DRAFT_388478 [Xylariaceae sp. FL1019]|nr:hypothetical protein F5Y18DRAFT_388478 [Xylariaceae sp. FL1019]